jgi:predicted amidohydrolase YtcJ
MGLAEGGSTSAVAVKGEKILDVGADQKILALRGPQTKVVWMRSAGA